MRRWLGIGLIAGGMVVLAAFATLDTKRGGAVR